MTDKKIAEHIEYILESIRSDENKTWSLLNACHLSTLCGVGEQEIISNYEFEEDSEIDFYVDELDSLILAGEYNQIVKKVEETLIQNEKYEVLNYLKIIRWKNY